MDFPFSGVRPHLPKFGSTSQLTCYANVRLAHMVTVATVGNQRLEAALRF